jgi:hypothetical protein
MEKILFIIGVITMLSLAGCSTQNIAESNVEKNNNLADNSAKDIIKEKLADDSAKDTIKEESKGLLDKVTDSFSSDVSKLEKEFNKLNDEKQTFFTDIQISKDGKNFKIDLIVSPNATSKMILNILTLGISVKTYEVTQDFENIKINFLDSKKKILGAMTIPQKAIKDMADYANKNDDDNYMENPYVEPFWKISQIMYDESVPEFMPKSMAEDVFGGFGNDADDIAKAMDKTVTHLEIDCGISDNWDADADDDGITYKIKPLASDDSPVPLEGSYETKVYEKVKADEWGFKFKKGKLLYSKKGELKGQDRLQDFDTWSGYSVQLSWDDVESYMASSSNYGIMYVTFTDLDGNDFKAKTGEGSYGGCQLRES